MENKNFFIRNGNQNAANIIDGILKFNNNDKRFK